MADGEIKIKTSIDSSDADKQLKDLNKKLTDAGKTIDSGNNKTKNFVNTLKNMSAGAVAAGAGFTAAAVAVKKTVDALNDCERAYQAQRKAEVALTQAAKNNPYLNDEAVYNLKQFASELQSMSEVGDEVSLQVMSQLAAAGRNEEQIMQIMSAAADMAAVTGEDIASAAQKLNATLNGNAGALGRQITSINNLTKAELESGKAIQIVASQYKGSAEAMADKTVQLNNAWGDFKENIGRGWDNVTKPVKEFFLGVLDNINEAQSKAAALKSANKAAATGSESINDAKLLLDEAQAVLNRMNSQQGMTQKGGSIYFDKNWEKKRDAQAEKVKQLTERYNELAAAAEAEAKAQEEAAIAAERAAEVKGRDAEATTYINANRKALAEQIKAIELKTAITGQDIDEGEMYNAYMQSYIDLITKSNGLVSENNTAAKERLALVLQWAQASEQAASALERQEAAEKAMAEAAELLNEVNGLAGNNSYFDQYIARNEEILALKQKVNDSEVLSEEQKLEAMKKLDDAYAQNRKDLWKNVTGDINNYTQQAAQVAKDAGDLMLQNVQSQKDAELAELEEKYKKGEISEEEYYEKQKQIKRKAAQEEYKIQMFQWTASILAATANIAEGVSKAIAQGGVAGLITGSLVSAAGAVQIASIVASKPVPPQFASGGVIGGMNGATMGGDNTYIHARAGEMVLNANQQRSLWDMINGQDSRAQAGFNLTVNNTQSDRVETNIRQGNNELFIDILDKHINKGFSDGTFDPGMAAMNTRQEGVRIL